MFADLAEWRVAFDSLLRERERDLRLLRLSERWSLLAKCSSCCKYFGFMYFAGIIWERELDLSLRLRLRLRSRLGDFDFDLDLEFNLVVDDLAL